MPELWECLVRGEDGTRLSVGDKIAHRNGECGVLLRVVFCDPFESLICVEWPGGAFGQYYASDFGLTLQWVKKPKLHYV